MPRKKLLKLVREKESNNNNNNNAPAAELALVPGCTLSKEYVPAETRETDQDARPKKKRRKNTKKEAEYRAKKEAESKEKEE